MVVHNPLSASRLCVMLGVTLEPFEALTVPDGQLAGFVKCQGCQCVVSSGAQKAKPQKSADKGS